MCPAKVETKEGLFSHMLRPGSVEQSAVGQKPYTIAGMEVGFWKVDQTGGAKTEWYVPKEKLEEVRECAPKGFTVRSENLHTDTATYRPV